LANWLRAVFRESEKDIYSHHQLLQILLYLQLQIELFQNPGYWYDWSLGPVQ